MISTYNIYIWGTLNKVNYENIEIENSRGLHFYWAKGKINLQIATTTNRAAHIIELILFFVMWNVY